MPAVNPESSTVLFADAALARRLELTRAGMEADFPATLCALDESSAACLLPIAGGYAVAAGEGYPINAALGLGMEGPVLATDLERVEEFYAMAGLPARVALCPLADPSLAHLLGERGYRIERFFHVFVRSLDLVPAFAPGTAPEIRVERIEDEELWVRLATGDLPGDGETVWTRLARATFRRPGVRCWGAYLGGEAVGAGALGEREGLASLFWATTAPAFRRRGVQRALIQARLAATAANGCDLATVQATPGSDSHRNIERAGFRIAYTQLMMLQSLPDSSGG